LGYRPSQYNIVHRLSDGRLAVFNTASRALATLDEDPYVRAVTTEDGLNEANPDVLASLLRGRFIVPSNVDEVARLRVAHSLARFSRDRLALTILPTLACSLRCVYCYQGSHDAAQSMSDEVERAIVNFTRVIYFY